MLYCYSMEQKSTKKGIDTLNLRRKSCKGTIYVFESKRQPTKKEKTKFLTEVNYIDLLNAIYIKLFKR